MKLSRVNELRTWLAAGLSVVFGPALANAAIPTIGPIDTSNSAAVVAAYKKYFDVPDPAHGFTGSVVGCTPGTIALAYQEWVIQRLNLRRAMVGLPGVTLDTALNPQMQATALLQAANNNTKPLDHYPTEAWTCWTPTGAEGSLASNLNVGNDPDPITSFMTDPGDTNAAVLHRRSIIHASLESVGFGVALSEPNGDRGSRLIAALGKPTYLQTPADVPNGIAWPPRGFVPLEFFPDSGFRTTEGPRWSFTLRGAANFAAATVSMRLNGEVVPAKVVWPRPSRGEPSATIVWELPVRHRAAKNTRYDVTISGVTGAPSASYSYVVLPFDPKDPNQPIDPLALRTAGLVGPGASPLSVTRFPDGRLDLFGLGYDLSMQHKAWPAGAVAGRYDGVFASLGAPFLATVPSAVSWEAGRIDLFALDINRVLRHRAWRDGAFSNSNDAWEDLGGESASPPAVVAPAKDRLDVVVVGTDGAAWHKSWNGSRWVDWASLGGAFKSPVAAASWGADRLDVFGLDGDFRVLHRSRTNGTWAPTWTSLGPRVFNSVPAPVSAGPNQLAVFGIGTDGALCQKSWVNGAWTKEWASLGKSRGGEFVGTLSVVSSGQGRIDVFALGKDRNIYHRAFSGGKWEPEANLGGGFNWGPVATVVGANTLHVFAMRSDRTIHHNSLATTTIASLGQGRNEETVRQVWSTWQLVGGPFAKVSGVFVDQR